MYRWVMVAALVATASIAHAGAALGRLPRVVDSQGRAFASATGSAFLRKEGRTLIRLSDISREYINGPNDGFYHEGTTCSGQRYLPVDDRLFIDLGMIVREIINGEPRDRALSLHYADGPRSQPTLRSRSFQVVAATCLAAGGTVMPGSQAFCCVSLPDQPASLGWAPAKTIDVSDLVPPFSLK